MVAETFEPLRGEARCYVCVPRLHKRCAGQCVESEWLLEDGRLRARRNRAHGLARGVHSPVA